MSKQQRKSKRIALFVEGATERGDARQKTLPPFLKKWLDPKLPERSKVGIQAIKFQGVSNYLDDVRDKVELHLTEGRADFVFGLVDLYGLPQDRFDFSGCVSVKEKVIAARRVIKDLIPPKFASRFRQHFAVHEVEAWLLAYPEKFSAKVRDQITKRPPEEVNLREPPAKLLKRLMGGSYKKTVFARNVFPSVDPQVAIAKCPFLRLFVDDLLAVAEELQKN